MERICNIRFSKAQPKYRNGRAHGLGCQGQSTNRRIIGRCFFPDSFRRIIKFLRRALKTNKWRSGRKNMSRLRMNWITVPALQLLLSLHAEAHLSFSLLFARRCHAWAPDHARDGSRAAQDGRRPPPSPPIRVITSRPLNIRILSPLCVQSPSGICRPSSRFASYAGFWLAPWFIGPRNSYDGRNPREIEVMLGLGESFKRRAALETRRKAMSPLSELLHNVLLSAPRWGGSDRRRRDGALSV